jgi:hypothetical protein
MSTPAVSPPERPRRFARKSVDLPEDWRLTQGRRDESYRWPKQRDSCSPYRVFLGTICAEGAVQIGLGETIRENAWGPQRQRLPVPTG